MFRKYLYLCSVMILFAQTTFAQTVKDLNEELKYLAEREMIISKNLANIDTPGFKPQDIKKQPKRETIQLSVTHPAHMRVNQNLEYDLIQGDIVEIKPNGNAVTAEHELAKKNENQIQFNKTSNIVSTIKNMTRSAIKGSN